jgi:broad specificity phosphatase PhoE
MLPRDVYFITHSEVRVDPQTPVPNWSLSERGLSRMRAGLDQPWLPQLTAVYSSEERKAREGAAVVAERLGLTVRARAELGEIDRSATGYLPHAEHEARADLLFANPDRSARGWETSRHAQQRIVDAVHKLVTDDETLVAIAIVSHGAVGALLLCHLSGLAIDRLHDQPGSGGGNYFCFNFPPGRLRHGWSPFDRPVRQ